MSTQARSTVEPDQRLDEVLAAYVKAVEALQPADRKDLLVHHPELAGELAELFAGLDKLQQLAALRPAVRQSTADPSRAEAETVDHMDETGPYLPAAGR